VRRFIESGTEVAEMSDWFWSIVPIREAAGIGDRRTVGYKYY
jgi:hypothetical protein